MVSGRLLAQALQALRNVLLDALQDALRVGRLGLDELLAGDVLVELHVAVGDARHNLRSHLGNPLPLLTLETVGHEPFADELLRQLALALAPCKALLVSLGVEVARRVGRVDFVHEVDDAVLLAELILRVDENQPHFCSNLAAAAVDGARVALQLLVILAAYESRRDNLLLRDILVVALGGLRGRGDNRLGELLVLDHAVGHLHAADGPLAGLVLAPCVAREVAADDHLHLERLALAADGDHRVGHGQLPVREDVGGGVEELGGNLVQNLALVGNALGQDDVEGRDAVGDHHDQVLVVDVVDVADFSRILALLSFEGEIGASDSVHCV